MVTEEQLSNEFESAMHDFDVARLACVGVAAKIEYRIRRYRAALADIFDDCFDRTLSAIDDGEDNAAYEAARCLCAAGVAISETLEGSR